MSVTPPVSADQQTERVIWERLARAYSGHTDEAFDNAPAEYRQAWFDDTEAMVAVAVDYASERVAAAVGPGQAEEAVAPQLGRDLTALSQWINAGNAHRHPEAVLWSRVLKVTEEAGEVYEALSGAIGENPRKGVTHTMGDVVDELLDVASAALCAVEHIQEHRGRAVDLLAWKVRRTAERAGLDDRPVCNHGYALLWGETCPENHHDGVEVDPCPSTLRDGRPHPSAALDGDATTGGTA